MYAVTAVFYLKGEDEDQVKTAVIEMINESHLVKSWNESVDIVDTCEVKVN